MGIIIFTHNNAACGILVDPVYDARTQDAVDTGQGSFTVIHDGIDECTCIVPGSGMDDHALGLVDDEDILIFIQDIQRNILRQYIREHPHREDNGDCFIFRDTGTWFHRPAVYPDQLFFDQFFEITS